MTRFLDKKSLPASVWTWGTTATPRGVPDAATYWVRSHALHANIGCLFDQCRGGNRNLFCCSGALWDACFVVVGLYIVCFMHVLRQIMAGSADERRPPACDNWTHEDDGVTPLLCDPGCSPKTGFATCLCVCTFTPPHYIK